MKINPTVKNKGLDSMTQMTSVLRRSSLAMAVSCSCMAMHAGSAQAAYDSGANPIGDLSIYKPSQDGGANVMMMLDASGSMGMLKDKDNDFFVDSIFADAEFSCVNDGQTRTYSNSPKVYKIWHDKHGLGLFDESITIGDETLKYTLQGCTPGKFNTSSKEECTNEEVTEDYDYTGTVYKNGISRTNQKLVKDPNGEYFWSSSYGAFYSKYDYDLRGRTTYRIARVTTEEVCETVFDGDGEWELDDPSKWTWDSTEERYKANDDSVIIEDGNRLDRMSRLKRALIQALGTYTQDEVNKLPPADEAGYGIAPDGRRVTEGDYKIESKNLVGIGQFSANTSTSESETDHDGSTGQILVAAQELTKEHRIKLIKTIMDFDAQDGTPAANAYAEAGAYLRGKSTKGNTSSGFYNRVSWHETASNVKDANNYVKPGTDSKYQCYGKGIFFLTDGFPNSANSNSGTMMAASLGLTNAVFDSDYSVLPTINPSNPSNKVDYVTGSGWPDIGRYAQGLRTDNKFTDIKTATVGFGKLFNDLKQYETQINVVASDGRTLVPETVINCDADSDIAQDAINLCNWGVKENYTKNDDGTFSVLASDKKYGGGGFTAAKTSDDIANSLIAFIRKSKPNTDAAPGGTISVPIDPYRGGNITPYAYLPMLSPAVDSGKTIWQGNLKKYETKNGTLYGQNDERLYTSLTATSRGGEFRSEAADLWEKNLTAGMNHTEVTSGGFYTLLRAPTDAAVGGVANVRNVFVESYDDGSTDGLTNIGVAENGTPSKFNQLKDEVYGGSDTTKKTLTDRILLNFLGYNLDPDDPALQDKGAELNMKDGGFAPVSKIRTLGGVIHSSPSLVSLSAEVDDLGQVTTDENKRDEYLLFGSMDGSLHLVDAKTGEEQWAMILQEMFRKQSSALVNGSDGSLKFGVDAPWLVSAKYNYKAANEGSSAEVSLFKASDDLSAGDALALENTVNFEPLAAYGGFRMGGDGLYGIRPYPGGEGKQPSILFSITPDTDNTDPVLHKVEGSNVVTSTTQGYENVGQIWNRVTMGRLFATAAAEKPHDVIIFGGGYDERYESPTFVPSDNHETDPTKGSSLYIANAKTGEKIWSWNNEEYNHSIVAGVTTLDRDGDGYFDYLYFADLGGNVFRAAFVNEKGKAFTQASVTRVFGASDELSTDKKHLAYRFYNRPVVSFYNDEIRGELFATINVASGNKSSPLSKLREDNDYSNKVYGIIDREITTGELLTPNSSGTFVSGADSLTEDDLTKLGYNYLESATESNDNSRISELCSPLLDANGNVITSDGEKTYSALCKSKVTLVSDMINETGNTGWYYPLTRFDGYANVKNVKAFGDYSVIDGTLYISAYESDLGYQEVDVCDGDIKGVTENQLYCLPYGVCMHDSSLSGTGGYIPVGKGMQELTFGALDSENTNISTLLGTSTLEEKADVAFGYGNDDKKGNVATKCSGSDNCDESQYSNWSDAEQEVSGGTDGSGPTPDKGDGLGALKLNTSRFILVPQRWYELNK